MRPAAACKVRRSGVVLMMSSRCIVSMWFVTWARPREKRDAILGHVASWGDRKSPHGSNTADLADSVNRVLDDQHHPRGKKKHQHDLAECCLIKAAEEFEAQPCAGEKRRQSDQE